MNNIFQEIEDLRSAGCGQMFLLTGNVHDVFPHPTDPDSTELFDISQLLRLHYPEHFFAQLSFSRGLEALDAEQAKKFRNEVLGQPDEPAPAANDPIAQARQAMRPQQQQLETNQLTADPRTALAMLNVALAQDKIKILVFIERLASLAPPDLASDREARFVRDELLRFANMDGITKRDHLIVALAREVGDVDREFAVTTNRLVQKRLPRPSEDDRRKFVERLTLNAARQAESQKVYAERQSLITAFVDGRRVELAKLQAKAERLQIKYDALKSRDIATVRTEIESKVAELRLKEAERAQQVVAQIRQQIIAAEADLAGIMTDLARRKVNQDIWLGVKDGDVVCGRTLQNEDGKTKAVLESYVIVRGVGGDVFLSHSPNTNQTPGSLLGASASRKGYQFYWFEKLQVILGFDADRKQGAAFHLPHRQEQDDKEKNLHCWLYLLQPGETLVDLQRLLVSWDSKQKLLTSRREQLEPALAGGGQVADDAQIVEIRAGIEEQEVRLRSLASEIAAEFATAQDGVRKEIGSALGKRQQAERVIRESENGSSEHLPADKKSQLKLLDERLAVLNSGHYSMPATDIVRLARLSNGLGYRHLRDLLATGDVHHEPLDERRLLAAKTRMLNEAFGHLLEVVESPFGFEGIGGMEDLKDEFKAVVRAILDGNLRAVPQNILFEGPPGTGKTVFAEALAKEAKYTYVKVRNVRNMYVGETERRIEELMWALRELAPVVVLRDEIDEEDSGRDTYQGDSGVSGRVRRAWMTLMSDETLRGRVVIIAATNRPDRMDAALLRAGRFDWRIAVTMPDRTTQCRIFEVMFAVRHKVPTEIRDFRRFTALTDGLSGADLGRLTLDAYMVAQRNGRTVVTEADLQAAIEDYCPSVNPAEVDRMTKLAVRHASHMRFVPPYLRGMWHQLKREAAEAAAKARAEAEAALQAEEALIAPPPPPSPPPPSPPKNKKPWQM